MARTLELEGRLGFRCPLLEDPRMIRAESMFEPGISYRELAPVLNHPRAGVMAAVSNGRTLSYAVFGPPAVFRRAPELPFELDEDALLIAALYAGPEARPDNLDVDLLLAVLGFARAQGYARVQVLCRSDSATGPARAQAGGPEARAEIIAAAGFEIADPLPGPLPDSMRGLRLGSIAISDWEAKT